MKHHHFVLSLCALAVMASPLTLDHVLKVDHHAYRSIASEPAKGLIGPVNEKVKEDSKPYSRFSAKHEADIKKVERSQFSETGAALVSVLEEKALEIRKEGLVLLEEIKKAREAADSKTESKVFSDRLVQLVGRLEGLDEKIAQEGNKPEVSADPEGFFSATFDSVVFSLSDVVVELESLDKRIVEIKDKPQAATVAQTAVQAHESSHQNEARRSGRTNVARRQQSERADNSCQAAKTPEVAPQAQQMQLMMTMMMSMISMNQTMISMMQMQMQQNMLGNYFNQATWPNQNYASFGLGIGSFDKFQPTSPLSNSLLQLHSNPYTEFANQLQLSPSLTTGTQPLTGAFNFGGDIPTAQFNNFAPFSGQQIPAVASL